MFRSIHWVSRILERGRDAHTGDVGGLLEPVDQVRRD